MISGDSSLDSLETGSSVSSSSKASSLRSVQIIGSDSESSSCYSNESGRVTRSGRSTPVRDFDDSSGCHSNDSEAIQGRENTPTKRNTPTRAAKSRNSPAKNTPTKTTPKANLFNVKVSSAKKDVLVENKDILRVKGIEDDNIRKNRKDTEENLSKTPDRKRGSLNSDEDGFSGVKKCKTEPRRKSLQPQVVVRKSQRTEVKVRRAQSVRIKRVGNEYQSFRDQTPDSSGPRTRTRLSEKFENCDKAKVIRRSGREAFTEITNKQSPASRKPSQSRSNQSPARNKTPVKSISNQSHARTSQSRSKPESASKKLPVKSSQSPAVSGSGKSPKTRVSRRK